MKSGILTIMKKELARFFGDKRTVAGVLLPGVMIYVLYSFMGTAMGSVFGVEPPNFVELVVTETDPGFAGNTATNNVLKPATLETGAEIKVPLFVNPGDKIKIDTRTGEYLERCKA